MFDDSHYVFLGLARRFLLFDFAVSWRHALLDNFGFKTPARIKIPRHDATFCALAPVAWQFCFRGQCDPEGAQDTFFLELRKRQENKGKSIEIISLRHVKTPKYLKSAQYYKQNWIH